MTVSLYSRRSYDKLSSQLIKLYPDPFRQDIFLFIVLAIIGGIVYAVKAPAVKEGISGAQANLKVSQHVLGID